MENMTNDQPEWLINWTWYDDTYWSKVLFTTILTLAHDLKFKVSDLEL